MSIQISIEKLFLQAAREINKKGACKIGGWPSCWAYYFKTLNLCMNSWCHFFIFDQSVISLSISKAFIRWFINYASSSIESIKNHQTFQSSVIINSWLWITNNLSHFKLFITLTHTSLDICHLLTNNFFWRFPKMVGSLLNVVWTGISFQ